jgi:hypothetical protein
MTGGARGFCAGSDVPGYANAGLGRGAGGGRGWARGGGRGRRNRFYATGLTGWQRAGMGYPEDTPVAQSVTKEEQLTLLKNQTEHLKNALQDIQQRVSELEAGGEG